MLQFQPPRKTTRKWLIVLLIAIPFVIIAAIVAVVLTISPATDELFADVDPFWLMVSIGLSVLGDAVIVGAFWLVQFLRRRRQNRLLGVK